MIINNYDNNKQTSFYNARLWREGCRKTEFTKKLLKNKLTATPTVCIVWCYAKHHQDLFEELMKMNVEYVEGIPGDLGKCFKKNKRNFIIIDDEASKSIKITTLFARGRHGNLFNDLSHAKFIP